MESRENQQQIVSDVEIGWLCGIIDGEGSICLQINKRKNRTQVLRVTPKVIISNTDKGIVEQTANILRKMGIGRYVTHTSPNNSKHVSERGLVKNSYKDITRIVVSGMKRVQRILGLIQDNLYGDKKQKAILLKKFVDRRLSLNNEHYSNYYYDSIDVENMTSFLRLTKSK